MRAASSWGDTMKVRKPRRVRESPSTREMEEEDTRSSEDTSRVEQDPGSRIPGQREDAFRLELETKVHQKVRNHGEGPY